MRCLVLGGAGFIGSHVVEALHHAGHRVSVFDLHPNPLWSPPVGVLCEWGDWQNMTQLSAALTGTEAIIHLISTSVPATANQNLSADAQANVLGTLTLLERCVQYGVQRIIFASSGGTVYGIPNVLPIAEDHPTNPIGGYGAAKLAIEKYLRVFAHLHGLHYIILRGGNPFGERHNPKQPQGAVGVFMKQLARDLPIEIIGDGQMVRDYFYVGDMAQAFRLAVESPLRQGVFNVGSGQGLSLVQLLAEISAVTGLTPHVIHRPARPSDVPTNILDITRIGQALGWRPTTSIRAGLARTWAWTAQHMGVAHA